MVSVTFHCCVNKIWRLIDRMCAMCELTVSVFTFTGSLQMSGRPAFTSVCWESSLHVKSRINWWTLVSVMAGISAHVAHAFPACTKCWMSRRFEVSAVREVDAVVLNHSASQCEFRFLWFPRCDSRRTLRAAQVFPSGWWRTNYRLRERRWFITNSTIAFTELSTLSL